VIGFANPWALLGAVALGVPMIVHLLRRRRAERLAFPTLRFLPAMRVDAVRWDRLTDVPLLMIRLLVIAAAVAAVAQPVLRAGRHFIGRESADLSRAIVTDRAEGIEASSTQALSAAPNQKEIVASDLRAGLAAAVGWLARQGGSKEMVVSSRFVAGSLRVDDLDAVPSDVGLRFVPVEEPAVPAPATMQIVRDRGVENLAPALTLRPGELDVSWNGASTTPSGQVDWRIAPGDGRLVEAAQAAATDAGVAIGRANRRIVVALPGAPDLAALESAAKPIDRPWMFEFIRALAEDGRLSAASQEIDVETMSASAAFTPVVYDRRGNVLLWAAKVDAQPEAVLLRPTAPASSFTTAALASAIPSALAHVDWSAIDSARIPREVLAAWERPARPAPPASNAEMPIGRWLWLTALLFLAAEWWWRRRSESRDPAEIALKERHVA
jgi:hypothetical protein